MTDELTLFRIVCEVDDGAKKYRVSHYVVHYSYNEALHKVRSLYEKQYDTSFDVVDMEPIKFGFPTILCSVVE